MVVQRKYEGTLPAEDQKYMEDFFKNIQSKITNLKWEHLVNISDLDLTNCGLTTLPNALKNFPIKKINLSQNDIKDIPHCFYLGLDKIENLDFSHNKIEKFEVQPNCCKTLKVLSLCSNKLKNIPQWILDLQANDLVELKYDFNKITTLRCIFDIPMYFPVRKLSLMNCILRKEDLKFIKGCKNLEELNISNSESSNNNLNIFEDIDYLFIQPTWGNMKILKLNHLVMSIFPAGITWLETLTHLYLSNNDFQWLPTDGLEYLVNLEELDLSHNSITSIPEKLAWLEHVRMLNFSHNNIEAIPNFSKMSSLESLDLYYNKLIDFNCDMSGTNLKCLDLEYNLFNTENCQMVNYKNMKNYFRKNVCSDKLRFDGYRLENRFEEEDSDKESDCEDCENLSDCLSESKYDYTEDWDEEIRMNAKNDLISPSDDEWQGLEEVKIKVKKKSSPVQTDSASIFKYNEAVMFCDAD